MADHIPFITGEESCRLAAAHFKDSEVVRIPLDVAARLTPKLATFKLWLDPAVDGLDDLESRRPRKGRPSKWFDFMSQFPHFTDLGSPSFQKRPPKDGVQAFVNQLMAQCARHDPTWISVPQLPVSAGTQRNKLNRALAAATGLWTRESGYRGKLILPLVFTKYSHLVGRTQRRPRIECASKCYDEANADGFWVVDKSADDGAKPDTQAEHLKSIVDLHRELNDAIGSTLRIAGPYWGLNLVLWARALVDYPAVGVGSGFQYFLSGGFASSADAKLALAPLRRRAVAGAQLKEWLDRVARTLPPAHPAHGTFSLLRRHYSLVSAPSRAREQIVAFYKEWYSAIAAVPAKGRSMALFQDLSAAYALGKILPNLEGEGAAREAGAVAQALMLNCL